MAMERPRFVREALLEPMAPPHVTVPAMAKVGYHVYC